MDLERLDAVIQYALACAQENEDWKDRSLCTTELIKYVYLADLAYAERHGGTFTGAAWRFHHFGPWDGEIAARLEPATKAVGGHVEAFNIEGGATHGRSHKVTNSDFKERLVRKLPPYVATAIRRHVRQFGSQARNELLHLVYETHPMLAAAPGESLVFSKRPEFDAVSSPAALTPKQQKKRKDKIHSLKARVAERMRNTAPTGRVVVTPTHSPAVLEALKNLRIDEIEEDTPREGTLVFSDEIWRAPSRTDDLP